MTAPSTILVRYSVGPIPRQEAMTGIATSLGASAVMAIVDVMIDHMRTIGPRQRANGAGPYIEKLIFRHAEFISERK